MCPISFNIYGIKINDGHFSTGTVVIQNYDNPYQQTNFKSHYNTVILCKLGKMLSD